MPSKVKVWTSLVVALWVIGCGGSEARSADDARFDALVAFTKAELARQNVPGAALAVVVDGRLAYSAGVGSKRQSVDDPVQADTAFGIGSVTKMLTAAGILTLREEGKVDLDAPVTRYVPYFQLAGADAPRSSSIQLGQLLSHTAGLPDGGRTACTESLSEWFHDETKRMPLWYEPGKLWDYSNPGYALAGLVLEEVAGKPYAQAMQERVFGPLGMRSATFDAKVAMARNHAMGHVVDDQGTLREVELDEVGCPATAPEGNNTYVTAPDLARFALALLDGGGAGLTPATVEALETPRIETHATPGEGYGFGLFSTQFQGTRVLYHGGDDMLFNAILALVPERGFAAVVLFNRDTGGSGTIAAKAVELFLGIVDGDHPEWQTPPSTWAKYVGEYDEPFTYGRIRVSLEGEKLMVEAEDLAPGEKLEMTQLAADHFAIPALPGGPLDVTFWFDGDSNAARYVVSRGGVAVRVP